MGYSSTGVDRRSAVASRTMARMTYVLIRHEHIQQTHGLLHQSPDYLGVKNAGTASILL
jgi:hypothetical protein